MHRASSSWLCRSWSSCRRVGRRQVGDLGRARSENHEFQAERLHYPMGSEDLCRAQRGWGSVGRCEQSSSRKPGWARRLVSGSSP